MQLLEYDWSRKSFCRRWARKIWLALRYVEVDISGSVAGSRKIRDSYIIAKTYFRMWKSLNTSCQSADEKNYEFRAFCILYFLLRQQCIFCIDNFERIDAVNRAHWTHANSGNLLTEFSPRSGLTQNAPLDICYVYWSSIFIGNLSILVFYSFLLYIVTAET